MCKKIIPPFPQEYLGTLKQSLVWEIVDAVERRNRDRRQFGFQTEQNKKTSENPKKKNRFSDEPQA